MWASCQRSRLGTNSSAIKRRACSSSRTTSSLIQAGRGRLRASIGRLAFYTQHRTGSAGTRGGRPGSNLPVFRTFSVLFFGRVLHVLDLVDLDILAFAIDFLHLADIDVLHDIAGVRVN